jgi:hypothetical protein
MMKKLFAFLVLGMLFLGTTPLVQATPLDATEYTVLRQRIHEALRSHHTGLQESALQLVIQYGDQVTTERTVRGLKRLYRTTKDDAMRQMVVVALSSTHHAKAMRFLKRNVQTETSDRVKRTMEAIMAQPPQPVAVTI